MTDQNTFLRRVIEALIEAEIPYMIAGSVGSSFHGQPRATNDADIVIDPTKNQLSIFLEQLVPDFYVSQQAALQALEDRAMFNVIDIQSGYKADLIIRKQRPFSQQEFSRRISAHLLGMDAYVLSPEDSILSKLEWTQGRDSQTQLNDALGVLNLQKDKIDFDYLKHWAKELGILDALEQLLNTIDK